MMRSFPEDFLWGASTSAFQCEGAYNEGGKGPATTDFGAAREGIADCTVASDHYHHWQEDIALMKELGLKAYRMGFSWSRIMPDEKGTVNEEGLAFYDRLIDTLLENGIEPVVTLYHFECPKMPVDAFGGWKDRRMIGLYVKYAEVCFRHFKGRVKRWVTVNEQLIATAPASLTGDTETDPFQKLKNVYQISYHVSLGEHLAMARLREIDPEAKIGPVCAMQVIYPATCDPEDIEAAKNAEELLEFYLLDMSARGKYSPFMKKYLRTHDLVPVTQEGDEEILKASVPDFIGVNYYCSSTVRKHCGAINYDTYPFFITDAFEAAANPYLVPTEYMSGGIDPLGLKTGIEKVYDRYQLPVIITENGMAAPESLGEDGKIHDDYRIDYLKKHIEQVYELIDEGVPVFGYCPWSFIDVVSSHQGFRKRYGLVFIDRTDTDAKECRRYRKDSYYWYQDIIRNNGLK